MNGDRSLSFRRGPQAASVIAAVGLIFLTSTTPASALVTASAAGPPPPPPVSSEVHTRPQDLSVGDITIALEPVRDSYSVTLPPPPAIAVSTTTFDGRNFQYAASASGAIRWPFPAGAPISSGFGPRHVPNCSFCSTFHEGLDFDPAIGTPVHAIAAGVVSLVRDDSGGLGDHVVISHVINGQAVESFYGHMGVGTIVVKAGETVAAGQVVGQVGDTGASTGAHLHLEIHVNGVPVDPFIWMTAHAG